MQHRPNLLLIEDDPLIGQSLCLFLGMEGVVLTHASSLEEARRFLSDTHFDLILLDINLPDGSGLSLCKELRFKQDATPIIAITANLDEETAIGALGLGANDFVRKPFSSRELFFRIKMRIKEQAGEQKTVSLLDLQLQLSTRQAFYQGKELELQRKEFDVLATLLRRVGQVFSREEILNIIDLNQDDINDRTVDSHMSHLRSKLKKSGCQRIQIKSVYGLGYKVVVE